MGWQYGSDPCDLIWRRPNSNGFDAYRIHMCMHRKLKTKFDSIKIGKSLDPYSGSKLYVTAIISTEKGIVDRPFWYFLGLTRKSKTMPLIFLDKLQKSS